MNETTELFLLSENIPYTTATIPVNKIDPASFKRQVRAEEIDYDLRDSYVSALTTCDEFPKIIVRPAGTGKYFVIDGIHRVSANTEIGQDHIDACVIDVDYETGRYISLVANRTHGKRTSKEEAVYHAIELHRNYNLSIADASRRMRISADYVARTIRRQNAGKRAASLAATGYNYLPISIQTAIAGIEHDAPFVEAITVCRERKPTVAQSLDMIRAAQKARSESEALQTIRTFFPESDGKPKTTRRGEHMASPVHRVKTAVAYLNGLDETDLADRMAGMSSEERARLVGDLRRAARRAEVIADALA